MTHNKSKFPSFLMRYGWIILAVLLIYSTFAFFDAITPFNKDYCKFSNQVKCIDLTYDNNQIQFALRSLGDYDYTDTKIILNDEESNTLELAEKEIGVYSINYNSSRVIKGTLTFSYINSESGLRHQEKGKFKLFP